VSHGAYVLANNSFIESHVTCYNKIYVKNPILSCFINVNLALMITGAIMMVCLQFYTLLLQWTSTMLRRYQARLFDLKSLFCGPYIYIQNVVSPLFGY